MSVNMEKLRSKVTEMADIAMTRLEPLD